jgi:hypothetical protein
MKLKPTLEKFFLFHSHDLDPWADSFNPASNIHTCDSQR